MAAMITIPTNCAHCGGHDVRLRRLRNGNASEHIAFYCLDCERWAEYPIRWLKRSELEERLAKQGTRIDQIPLLDDYSDRQPCIICGAPGEWHHWAPQSMSENFAPDWFKWPGAYLCREHHMLWHHVVTPELVR
jgi:hypothetical protein